MVDPLDVLLKHGLDWMEEADEQTEDGFLSEESYELGPLTEEDDENFGFLVSPAVNSELRKFASFLPGEIGCLGFLESLPVLDFDLILAW